MRALMILLTLSAASAGYVYLQQTPADVESYSVMLQSASLLNWSQRDFSVGRPSRVPVKNLVNRVHEQAKSVLDDFANQHSGYSDAPVDDAFERLRQVTLSTMTRETSSEASDRDVTESKETSASRASVRNDVQYTSFDSVDGADSPNDQTHQREGLKRDATSGQSPAVVASDKNLEPESASDRPGVNQKKGLSSANNPVTQVSQLDPKQVSKQAELPESAKRDVAAAAVKWKVVGKTTEGRPMHAWHLGDNGTRTLVIAGINGEDRIGVRWLEQLADEFARNPALSKDCEIVFFRAGNPDGLVHNKRDNARGVSLNRNFPSRRYRPTADMPGFAIPAGEVETRVVLESLYSFRPRRVIHLAATSGRSQVLYNRFAKNTATELERSAKLTLSPLDPEQYPGSLEDFADGTLEAAVLSISLSIGNDWQQAWTTLQPAVISAVVGQSIEAGSHDSEQSFDPDRSPIPAAKVEPVSQKPRRRGYEELPPPPM